MLCLLQSNISKEQRKKYLCNPSSHTTENTENVLVECVPQRLIIGKPISQYALYSDMLCPSHSKSLRKIQTLMKCAPHILICESHNASISAILNSFHNIVSKAWCEECLSDLYVLHWSHYVSTTNRHLTLLWRKNGKSKGYKGSTMMQAL